MMTALVRPIALCLSLLPAAAQADDHYGTDAGCARLAGQQASDGVWLYDGRTLQAHETTCAVMGTREIGSGAMALESRCAGRGQEWMAYYYLYTHSDPALLTLAPEHAPASGIELHRCTG